MYPYLLYADDLVVPSYSFMLALSFLAGGALFVLTGVRWGASALALIGLVISVQVAAMVGSRLLFVLNGLLRDDVGLSRASAISPGGFEINGGVAFGLLAGWLYLRLARLPFWPVADWAAPAIALGFFLAKTGCYMGGCCYGTPTALPWGVEFPAGSLVAQEYGLPHSVHPTQLYDGLYGLALGGLLVATRRRQAFEGQLFLIMALAFMAMRFLSGFVRGDVSGGDPARMTQTQVVSLILGAVAATILAARARAARLDLRRPSRLPLGQPVGPLNPSRSRGDSGRSPRPAGGSRGPGRRGGPARAGR